MVIAPYCPRFPIALLAMAVFLSNPSVGVANNAPVAEMPEAHFEFFSNYCLDCHDDLSEKGEVNLDELSFKLDTHEAAETWQKVLNVINSGEMPPEDKKQPEAEEKTEFLDDLSHQVVAARKILSDSGGIITMRRLNRREYENTIEDLLGIAIDAEGLPSDITPGTFDTVGSGLFFSSDQFEQYFDTIGSWRDTEKVGRKELPIEPGGTLPNGSAFANVQELKQVLLKHDHELAQQLVESMMTYALGRTIEFSDIDDVETILENLKADDYRIQSMIKEVALSPLFKKK